MFDALGAVLIVYLLYCLVRGDVFIRSGPWGRRVYRTETPRVYWFNMGIYVLLAIALITYF